MTIGRATVARPPAKLNYIVLKTRLGIQNSGEHVAITKNYKQLPTIAKINSDGSFIVYASSETRSRLEIGIETRCETLNSFHAISHVDRR